MRTAANIGVLISAAESCDSTYRLALYTKNGDPLHDDFCTWQPNTSIDAVVSPRPQRLMTPDSNRHRTFSQIVIGGIRSLFRVKKSFDRSNRV